MMTPYSWQQKDVDNLLAHNLTGVIAAETGAGKTLIGVEALRQAGTPVNLIIAPKGTVKKVWTDTILGQAPDARVRLVDGSKSGKEAMSDLEWAEPGWYIMTPNIFTRWGRNDGLKHIRADAMLVDEAHMLGNRDGAGGGLLKKFAGNAGGRMVASGTLFGNRFETVWTHLRFLYPERDEARDIADIAPNRWIDTYCATEYDHFAPGNRRVTGELNPGTIANAVPCWVQHFKRAECCEAHPNGFLEHLPEPIVIRETVELTPGQKGAMKQMQRDYLAYLDLATEEWMKLPVEERKKKALVTKMPIVREVRLSQMTLAMPSIVPRPWKYKQPTTANPFPEQKMFVEVEVDGAPFKQAVDENGMPLWDVIFAPDAESPKFDKLAEIHDKLREPIVAATNSQKFAELAVNRLNERGVRAFEWSGNYSQDERDAALEKFKAGKLDIIVGVTAAIGTGIDGLQGASSVLVSLNKDRDLKNETQLLGRLDRRGQINEDGVIHYEIIAEGSTDEGIIDEQLVRRFKLSRSMMRDVKRSR